MTTYKCIQDQGAGRGPQVTPSEITFNLANIIKKDVTILTSSFGCRDYLNNAIHTKYLKQNGIATVHHVYTTSKYGKLVLLVSSKYKRDIYGIDFYKNFSCFIKKELGIKYRFKYIGLIDNKHGFIVYELNRPAILSLFSMLLKVTQAEKIELTTETTLENIIDLFSNLGNSESYTTLGYVRTFNSYVNNLIPVLKSKIDWDVLKVWGSLHSTPGLLVGMSRYEELKRVKVLI
jgi:hypothetical protein